MSSSSVIRARVLGAIAAGLTVGCRADERAAPAPEVATVAPVATPAAQPPAPVAPAPASAPTPQAASAAPEPPAREPKPTCAAPTETCLDPRTPPPGTQVPNPGGYPYDKDGCLPADYVGHVCNALTVLSGPRVKGKKCCYTVCEGPVPPCGRPLVVGGVARVAPARPRNDWLAPTHAGSAAISEGLRAELRDAWLADAALEHASIASFARFSLELLAVGAPPDLVSDVHRAALDEIEHARLCYAMAARYGDRVAAAGPDRLPLGGVAVRAELGEIAAAAVTEGCLGETLAAAAARRAGERCEDEDARAALARIAEDELRHAELAWRFVAWAIREGGEPVRAQVAAAFAAGLPRFGAPAARDDFHRAELLAHGRLDATELARVSREVEDDVLVPCRDALLARA